MERALAIPLLTIDRLVREETAEQKKECQKNDIDGWRVRKKQILGK